MSSKQLLSVEDILVFGRSYRKYGFMLEQRRQDGKWYLAPRTWTYSTVENSVGPYDDEGDAIAAAETLITLNALPPWAKKGAMN